MSSNSKLQPYRKIPPSCSALPLSLTFATVLAILSLTAFFIIFNPTAHPLRNTTPLVPPTCNSLKPNHTTTIPFSDPSATYECAPTNGAVHPLAVTDGKDLFFSHDEPPLVLRAKKNTSCLIFSCSPKGYYLLPASLKGNVATLCDRVHFTVTTRTNEGRKVSAHWCRVALLRRMDTIFRGYRLLAYVDVDVVYDEGGVVKVASEMLEHQDPFVMSAKMENGKEVIRTSWFVVNVGDAARALVRRWARAYRHVFLQDQHVFNEICACGEVRCLYGKKGLVVERRHCGSYFSREGRVECLTSEKEGRFNWTGLVKIV